MRFLNDNINIINIQFVGLMFLKIRINKNLKDFFKIILILLILFGCDNSKNIKKLDYIEIVPKNVKSLVIILHGYGRNNEDMLFVAENLSKSFPNTAFVLPNAPFAAKNKSSKSFQWFSLNKPEFIMKREAKKANVILNNFIEEQKDRFSLNNNNIILSGFSQGAILSLYNGVRQKEELAGIISFSGLLPDSFESLKRNLKSKPNILLIHGTSDEVVDYSNLAKAEEILGKLKVPYEAYTLERVGHSIDNNALLQANKFIKNSIQSN